MAHAPAACGCFLSAPIARTFARMLSIGSQTTYSRMKVEVVGGGERMWQGIMSRAMRSKTASADGTIGSGGPYHRSRWATWVFLARLYLVRQKGIAPEIYLFT